MQTKSFLALTLVVLFLLPTVSVANYVHPTEYNEDGSFPYIPIEERYKYLWEYNDSWSHLLEEPGPYEILDVQPFDVHVDLPIEEGGAALTNSARVHVGLWLPDVPPGTKVPVVADFGPYYDIAWGADEEVVSSWMGEFFLEHIAPHGYGWAQVSLLGTGRSNHCMDYMGDAEQLGVNAAVEWLGTQDWSNGNVALMGKSYDGSTPWEAATFGNPHLKTVVPISGLFGMYELMYRNGSAESRSQILWLLYDVNNYDGDPEDLYNACPDNGRDLIEPTVGTSGTSDYWRERYLLDDVLANYEGSVFLIQGMQDWNVDPHMGVPLFNQLREAGIETKGLFGQWTHDYPDRADQQDQRTGPGYGDEAFPEMVRFDWGQELKWWFDYYLKGIGEKPDLHMEMQDNHGQWRIEENWPPEDAEWLEMDLGAEMNLVSGSSTLTPANQVVFESQPFVEETRIGGLPLFHVTVTPSGNGGQIFAKLEQTDGLRLGHAIMDLRFYPGGKESVTVTPGVPITALMEFFSFDVVIPAGQGLRLILTDTGEDYLPNQHQEPVSIDVSSNSKLKLPLLHDRNDTFFSPPMWWEPPQLDQYWNQSKQASSDDDTDYRLFFMSAGAVAIIFVLILLSLLMVVRPGKAEMRDIVDAEIIDAEQLDES